MRRFEPVPLPEGARTDRASMTLLRHFDNCERSAYLYLKHDGGVGSHPMRRGSALHRVLQLLTDAMVENGEPRVPPELAKAVVDEVLADPAYPCPVAEHDYLRESVYRWADETTFDPGSVIACETLFVLEIAGVEVRAKIDRAEVLEDGAVHVVDYKSARALPAYEDVARKRPDGSMAAKAFQLVVYGLALAYGRPVRIEPCAECGGTGVPKGTGSPPGTSANNCQPCMARGYVEVVEPFPLADRAPRFDLEYVYPGIETRDGKMATRPVPLTRRELEEYLASLGAVVKRFLASAEGEECPTCEGEGRALVNVGLESTEGPDVVMCPTCEGRGRVGDWPAVPGSWCHECPAEMECPIPRELRSYAGAVNTREEAAQTAMVVDRQKAWTKAVDKELREWVKRNGSLRVGDQVLEYATVESDEIRDKEGFLAAVQRAVEYGEPLDRAEWIRHKVGSRFRQRTMSEDEMIEEGSNGG
jgi:hypothetical protein